MILPFFMGTVVGQSMDRLLNFRCVALLYFCNPIQQVTLTI
jgi:hypothetical protein